MSLPADQQTRILMLLSNPFQPDPRVARQARTLAAAGYPLRILCWDREGAFPAEQQHDGYTVERIQSVRTRYGSGMRQILHTPRFWLAALHRARYFDPQVIHCHDLDTLPAGWWLKRRTGARLVYDAHEHYPALMSLYLPAGMPPLLAWMERRLLSRVDAVITASSILGDALRPNTSAPVITLGNYADLSLFAKLGRENRQRIRAALGLAPQDLLVAYIGGFSRNRLLAPFLEAARRSPQVSFELWGDGHQREMVKTMADQLPNVRYHGWLPQAEVPDYTQAADIIYYCLRPDYPGAVYNAPNTLANAMAAGRPVIANRVGDLGNIVAQTGCGLLLEEVNPQTIAGAILQLQDDTLRAQLGAAGRQAASLRYNWQSASQTLLELYTQLA